MLFAYKLISAGILVFTMLAGTSNPGPAQVIEGTDLLTDNNALMQTSIDSSKLLFEPVISGLSQPVFITNADDGSDRLFIIERVGRIRIAKNNVLLPTPFLDMQSIVLSTGSDRHGECLGDNTVEVRVGVVLQDTTLTLAQGARVRVGYPANNGPAQVVCTTCTSNETIITSLRVIWKEPGFRASYSEMMGLPNESLSDEYWFPWYNNLFPNTIMDQGFRISMP